MADRGGRRAPYRTVVRIHGYAIGYWEQIDGTCAAAGVDPFALNPSRFCNLVYSFCVQQMTPDDKAKFDAELDRPLPGEDLTRSLASPDQRRRANQDMASFAAWAQGMQGGR